METDTQSSEQPKKPNFEPHAPELYTPGSFGKGVSTLADIGPEAIASYKEHGYLVVENALSATEVEETLALIDTLIEGGWRGVCYEAGAEKDENVPVRKLAFHGDEARECGLLVDHPGLMKATRTLLGDRNPVLHQTMMLLKPPRVGREKPWHQDHAYFDVDVNDRMIGLWIALDEATIENGCMQFLDGGHKLGPIPHWMRRDWQICDTDIMGKKSVAVPLKPGGMIFFDSLTPHGTPNNNSPLPRKAVQLHYAPEKHRPVDGEERMAVFGSEGKDVSC